MKKQFNFYMDSSVKNLIEYIRMKDSINHMESLSDSQIVERVIRIYSDSVDHCMKIVTKGLLDHPYCPKCDSPVIEYEFRCSKCMTRLDWSDYKG